MVLLLTDPAARRVSSGNLLFAASSHTAHRPPCRTLAPTSSEMEQALARLRRSSLASSRPPKAALPEEGLDLLVWGAARVGDQATLRHLLAVGGGSSWTPSKDDERWGRDSPLRVASRFGHEGSVRALLESGVGVDEERADSGVTPLYLAAPRGTGGRHRAAPEGRG